MDKNSRRSYKRWDGPPYGLIDEIFELFSEGKLISIELVHELVEYFITTYDLQKLDLPNPQSIRLIEHRFPFYDYEVYEKKNIKFLKDLQAALVDYNVPDNAFDHWEFIAYRRHCFNRNHYYG